MANDSTGLGTCQLDVRRDDSTASSWHATGVVDDLALADAEGDRVLPVQNHRPISSGPGRRKSDDGRMEGVHRSFLPVSEGRDKEERRGGPRIPGQRGQEGSAVRSATHAHRQE